MRPVRTRDAADGSESSNVSIACSRPDGGSPFHMLCLFFGLVRSFVSHGSKYQSTNRSRSETFFFAHPCLLSSLPGLRGEGGIPVLWYASYSYSYRVCVCVCMGCCGLGLGLFFLYVVGLLTMHAGSLSMIGLSRTWKRTAVRSGQSERGQSSRFARLVEKHRPPFLPLFYPSRAKLTLSSGKYLLRATVLTVESRPNRARFALDSLRLNLSTVFGFT